MKVCFTVLGVFISALLFVACSSDDTEKKIYDLSFEKTTYDITKCETSIPIMGGNGEYTITSSDENIITGEYAPLVAGELGSIFITPHKTGKADITVTDNVTGQSKKLNFTIHNRYLTFTEQANNVMVIIKDLGHKSTIENELENKFSISAGEVFMLVDNGTNALYKFDS